MTDKTRKGRSDQGNSRGIDTSLAHLTSNAVHNQTVVRTCDYLPVCDDKSDSLASLSEAFAAE